MSSLHIALALFLTNVVGADMGGAHHMESSGCSASNRHRCIFPKAQPVETVMKHNTPAEEIAAPERDVNQHSSSDAQKTNPSFAPKADPWQVTSFRQKFGAKRVRRDLESAAGDEASQTRPAVSRDAGRSIETSIASVPGGSVVLSTVHTPSTVFVESSSAFRSTKVKDASGMSSQISTFLIQSEKSTRASVTANQSTSLSSSDNDIHAAIGALTGGPASPTSSSLHLDDESTPTLKAPIAFPNPGVARQPLRAVIGGLRGRAPVRKTTKVSSAPKIEPSDYDEVANLSCSGSLSCKNRCQTERHPGQTDDASMHCYCDPFCLFFQDCCADYGEHCTSFNYTVPNERWSMRIARGSHLGATYRGVWTISACPRNWSVVEVHLNCYPSIFVPLPPDYRDSIPVASVNGAVFYDRFCAECNGVPKEKLTFYQLEKSCFNNTEEERRCPSYDGRVNCYPLLWKPANGTYRRYVLNIVTRCPTGVSSAYRSECELDREYHVVSGIDATGVMVNYKNRFCALCHGAKSIRCGPVRRAGQRDRNISQTGGPFLKAAIPVPSPVQCSRGKVYDPLSRACREAATKQPSAPPFRRYRVVLHVSPSISLRPNNPTNKVEHPFKNALTSSLGIPSYHLANVLAITSADLGNKTIVAFDLDWPLGRKQQGHIPNTDAILNFTKPFTVEIDNQTHVVSNSSFRFLACAQYEEFTAEEYTVLSHAEPVVYIKESREKFHQHQYHSVESTWKNCQEQPKGGISVCRLYLTEDCQGLQVPLKRSEYNLLSNGAIYRHDSHETFEFETYDSRHGTIWICTNIRPQSETLNRAYLIVLYVGLSVSVLCLLGTLIVHGLFADLRTSFGLDTMNVAASLLLQQSLYFITWHVDSLAACSIAASLIHYFTLASFSWLTVIAWRTASAASVLRTEQQDADPFPSVGHVACCMASAWFLPLVFVVTSVALACSGIFPSAVGFGVPKACLLPSATVNVILLYVPIGMSLAIVVPSLISTALKRRKSRVQTEDAVVQEATSTLPEVIGLAVLMGATWICAFLGMVVSEKLAFPFVVLYSLQGVYLAVAFTLKRKLSELSGRVRCCADGDQRPNVQLKSIRPRSPVSPYPLDTRL